MSLPSSISREMAGKKTPGVRGKKANAFSVPLDLCPTSALNYATHTHTASEHAL